MSSHGSTDIGVLFHKFYSYWGRVSWSYSKVLLNRGSTVINNENIGGGGGGRKNKKKKMGKNKKKRFIILFVWGKRFVGFFLIFI